MHCLLTTSRKAKAWFTCKAIMATWRASLVHLGMFLSTWNRLNFFSWENLMAWLDCAWLSFCFRFSLHSLLSIHYMRRRIKISWDLRLALGLDLWFRFHFRFWLRFALSKGDGVLEWYHIVTVLSRILYYSSYQNKPNFFQFFTFDLTVNFSDLKSTQ